MPSTSPSLTLPSLTSPSSTISSWALQSLALQPPVTKPLEFSDLPFETREIIYLASIEEGRIVRICEDKTPIYTRDFIHEDRLDNCLKAITTIHPIQHVSRESRRCVLQKGCFEEQLQNKVYFDIELDVLCFESLKVMDKFFAGSVWMGCDPEQLKKKLPFLAFLNIKKIYMVKALVRPNALSIIKDPEAATLDCCAKLTEKYIRSSKWGSGGVARRARVDKYEEDGRRWMWVTEKKFSVSWKTEVFGLALGFGTFSN
ncbi:hypothetical protein BKA61DRAFT_568388 [Leptodontidium sp. MPI-SDFR-AT-0119]|nr:hypothetical protein BKA61DRAFT_568388 [Leptodontidium sp. MPI-SDFR-AT-0119]